MKIEIITPDQKLLEGTIESAVFPGTKGSFEVLNNHANIVSSLNPGVIVIKTIKGEKQRVKISGGVVEVSKNNITVLAESI